MELRDLGYWQADDALDLPDPARLVDLAWEPDERSLIARYLEEGMTLVATAGFSLCRICGQSNGSTEQTDGEFAWPSGLRHYVAEHSVRLPRAFVAHVRTRLAELEHASSNPDWWTAHAYDV